MDASQLREYVVRPALKAIDKWSQSAENLVMGTAAQESNLKYIHQLGNGPALGLFQMEPATYKDIWDNYIEYRADLTDKILSAIESDINPISGRMMWDLRLSAIMCRVHYMRVPKPLPDENDVWEMARYWKDFYNTAQGKGTVEEFVRNYQRVI